MSPRVYFFFISGAKKGKIEAVPAESVVRIGRQHYCEVQLDPYQDIPASGDHARVVREGGQFMLIDSGSTWGTWKNDSRVVGATPITTGDVITCGQDDRGRQGPQLRFYLAKDILSCPSCEGPVYKRHFKCPTCRKKYCLRCIDFRTKTCKPCATSPAGAPAPSPVGAPGFGPGPGPGSGLGAPIPGTSAPIRQTRAMSTGPAAAAARQDGFCNLCQDKVLVPTFNCPVCKRSYCVEHKHGAVCPPCAGIVAEANSVGGDSEPELKIPDLVSPQQRGPAPPPFQPGSDRYTAAGWEGGSVPPTDRIYGRDQGPQQYIPPSGGFTRPPSGGYRRPESGPNPRPPAPAQTEARTRAFNESDTNPFSGPTSDTARHGEADNFFTGDRIEAQRPPAIPCDRCQAPLSARDFFVCESCRDRLCSRHVSGGNDAGLCDSCSAQAEGGGGVPAPPPPPPAGGVVDPNRAQPPSIKRDNDELLDGVQFECPYCDALIAQGTESCPRCKRQL